jgi:hypothetical protein
VQSQSVKLTFRFDLMRVSGVGRRKGLSHGPAREVKKTKEVVSETSHLSGKDWKVKDWLTASEIAKLRLPGLPSTKVAIASRAEREKWPVKVTTGLGGQRNVYLVPDSYTKAPDGARHAEPAGVYDPAAGSGAMLQAAADYVAQARRQGEMSDADLIREVVLGVERWLERNNAHPDAEKKAALISLLFRYFQTDGAMDQNKMDELLKAVA